MGLPRVPSAPPPNGGPSGAHPAGARALQASGGGGNGVGVAGSCPIAEAQPHVSCPDCGGRVGYVGGAWQRLDVGSLAVAEEVALQRELNHCRPCVWCGCRNHLYLDLRPKRQRGLPPTIRLTFPGRSVEELPHTCSLDLADEHDLGMTFDEIAATQNCTRQRVVQVITAASLKLRRALLHLGIVAVPPAGAMRLPGLAHEKSRVRHRA